MELHPQERVDQFVAAHAVSLAQQRTQLDRSVQHVLAMYEDWFPDPRRMPGDALCSGVRAIFWKLIDPVLSAETSTLRAISLGSSKRLVDQHGATVRVRRHPWNYRNFQRVAVSEPPVETLFGLDYSVLRYELAVLWSPNLATKSLDTAFLAAVDGLDDDNRVPVIYATTSLPHEDIASVGDGQTGDNPEAGDDFEDFWPEEGVSGNEPA